MTRDEQRLAVFAMVSTAMDISEDFRNEVAVTALTVLNHSDDPAATKAKKMLDEMGLIIHESDPDFDRVCGEAAEVLH